MVNLPSCLACFLWLCNDLQIWSNLCCASSQWFGCSFYFYEAHSAVSSNGQSFMVAESGNLNACLEASLDNGVRSINLQNGLDIWFREIVALWLTWIGFPSMYTLKSFLFATLKSKIKCNSGTKLTSLWVQKQQLFGHGCCLSCFCELLNHVCSVSLLYMFGFTFKDDKVVTK